MKCAITGHTNGVGKILNEYFINLNYEIIGFSLSTGYDISCEDDFKFILHQAKECDVFVNNAYHETAQTELLMELIKLWQTDVSKTIINLSTRFTKDQTNPYCIAKTQQDNIIKEHIYKCQCKLINLKPGLIEVDTVKHKTGNRLSKNEFLTIFDFVFKSNIKIHEITFGV